MNSKIELAKFDFFDHVTKCSVDRKVDTEPFATVGTSGKYIRFNHVAMRKIEAVGRFVKMGFDYDEKQIIMIFRKHRMTGCYKVYREAADGKKPAGRIDCQDFIEKYDIDRLGRNLKKGRDTLRHPVVFNENVALFAVRGN